VTEPFADRPGASGAWTEGRRIDALAFEAREGARAIRARAEEEAARLLAEAGREVALLRERAIAEGRQEGLARAAADLAAAAAARDRLLAAAPGDLLDAAASLAERILDREVSRDEAAVVAMAERALADVRGLRRVVLRAHPDDVPRLRAAGPALGAAAETGAVSLRGDPGLRRGGVVVETEGGDVDARLDVQVEALRRALAELE
jgi:flagellar biosynthesis/type III secretory pathway protein FliH